MVTLSKIATALPEFSYSSREILEGSKKWLSKNPGDFELFERFVSSSKIGRRHFALPLDRIMTLVDPSQRAEIFMHEGVKLGSRAVEACLKESKRSPDEIKSVIFTSCSVPVIPSIDARIIQEVGIPLSVKRIPIYQHGCAGGAVALGLSEAIVKGFGPTMLISVELCSLVYQGGDFNPGNLVGSALFADGAAATLIEPGQGEITIEANASALLPASHDLMGYDISADGSHLRLKKELPSELSRAAPALIREFLKTNDLIPENIKSWLFHPGGVKILKLLEEEFTLQPAQTHWAWDVLENCGNMSSASILFVVDKFMRDREYKTGDRALVVGIGPGLTLELVLLKVN